MVGFLFWAAIWLFWYEPEHDEVEHWHAAWLMHQGQRPFLDFFEHHSPLLWNLLRVYYTLAGENFAIIPVSRALTILIFALTIWLAYRIAGRWTSQEGAWIAALGFPMFSFSLLLAHLFVRGDPFILLFLMLALWLAHPLADKRSWSKPEYGRLFWFFVCLGIALGVSPRAGIPALTLFLTLTFFGLRSLHVGRLLLIFLAGAIIVLIPTVLQALWYGPDLYFFWVYKFSATLYPGFSPLKNLTRLLLAAFPIWLLVGMGIYRFLCDPALRGRRSLWVIVVMAIVNFIGLWVSSRPYMQHFLMTIPFFGFLAGIGYDGLLKALRDRIRLPNWNWAGLLLLAGLLFLCGKSYRLYKGGGLESRPAWTERARWLLDRASDDATFAAGMAYFSPLFMSDSFYYWFAGRYAKPTLSRIQPDFQGYTLEDLQRATPTVLHESFSEAWGFLRSPQYQRWLEANYNPTPYRGYWLRKDAVGP